MSSRIEEAYKKLMPNQKEETHLDKVFKHTPLIARRASENTYLTQLTPANIKRSFDALPEIEKHSMRDGQPICANCEAQLATHLLRRGNKGPFHVACEACVPRVEQSL